MVKPVHPAERRKLDRLEIPPPIASSNPLRLVEPNHRFGEGIVVGIVATPDRRRDAGVMLT